MENEFHVERVHCCVCDGSGKVPKLLFWKRDCNVCDGTGKRQILIHKALTPSDRQMVIDSAVTGSLNYVPVGLLGIANSAANRWF